MSEEFRSRFAGKVAQRGDDGSVIAGAPMPTTLSPGRGASNDDAASAQQPSSSRAQPANRRLRASNGATRLPDNGAGAPITVSRVSLNAGFMVR
jgi:hypothetical protein